MALKLEGSIVAIVTPFKDEGKNVDYEALDRLVEFQISNGTDGIVPAGTTGEAPTLSHEEHQKVIEAVIRKVNKRVPVIAGTGSNSTEKTIEMTCFAKKAGADAALVVVPYYNKPTQEGLYLHFKAVASVGLPVVLYNVPGRSGAALTAKTIARLSQVPNIVAIKEASGSLDQVSDIISQCDIIVLSGDDSLTLPMISVGAKGVISVIANIVPDKLKKLVSLALSGDYAEARKVHIELFKLSRIMFVESNPIPVKTAMGLLGLSDSTLRLPMSPLLSENVILLEKVLADAGLFKKATIGK